MCYIEETHRIPKEPYLLAVCHRSHQYPLAMLTGCVTVGQVHPVHQWQKIRQASHRVLPNSNSCCVDSMPKTGGKILF